MFAIMALPLMGLAALAIDATMWTTASTRLQLAADAGAQSAAQMLSNATFQAQNGTTQLSSLNTVALYEAQNATGSLAGATSLAASVSYDTSAYKWVTVTVTAQAPTYFGRTVTAAAAPVMRAVSTTTLGGGSSAACVMALGTSGSTTLPNNAGVNTADTAAGGTGILVDNGAKLQAPNCPVYSNVDYNSATQYSVYVSGTGAITAQSVTAAGNIQTISSGTVSTPKTQNTHAAAANPYAGVTVSPPTTCTVGTNAAPVNTVNATTTYNAGTVFCGPVVFNSGGVPNRTITFNSGIYYVLGGNLQFSQMTSYAFASAGVTFVMLPNPTNATAAGNFIWSLNAPTGQTLTGMTTGPTAGMAIMQPCGGTTYANGQVTIFGSGLAVSGAIYAPCSEFQASSNATIAAPSGGTVSVVARVVHLQQGSTLTAGPATAASTTPVLTQ